MRRKYYISISTEPPYCNMDFSIALLVIFVASFCFPCPFSLLVLGDFSPFSISRFVSLWNLKRKPHDHTDDVRQQRRGKRERATCGKKDETPHNGQSSLIPRKHSKFLGPIDLFVYFQFQILKQFSFNPIFIVKIRGAKCQKMGSLCKGNPSECTPSWFLLPFWNYDFWHGRKMWRRLTDWLHCALSNG